MFLPLEQACGKSFPTRPIRRPPADGTPSYLGSIAAGWQSLKLTQTHAGHRRRCFDRFRCRSTVHPEAHASRSRPIRSRIAANSWRGTATSGNWNVTYLARPNTFAPILTSFSRNVDRVQLRFDDGSANCRKEFARL